MTQVKIHFTVIITKTKESGAKKTHTAEVILRRANIALMHRLMLLELIILCGLWEMTSSINMLSLGSSRWTNSYIM